MAMLDIHGLYYQMFPACQHNSALAENENHTLWLSQCNPLSVYTYI